MLGLVCIYFFKQLAHWLSELYAEIYSEFIGYPQIIYRPSELICSTKYIILSTLHDVLNNRFVSSDSRPLFEKHLLGILNGRLMGLVWL